MAKMVELPRGARAASPYYINPAHVTHLHARSDGGSWVHVVGEAHGLIVMLEPAEVARLIDEAME